MSRSGAGVQPADYCREVEAYLCRKNDGHLIRVVGPSFERVSTWAAQGIPLTIVFRGIDRHFERYYGKGPRRRPVRIDFCEADVLDVFDEWRRAVGITASLDSRQARESAAISEAEGRRTATGRASLPDHLERVLLRLSEARASGALDDSFESIIDRVAAELDAARSGSRGLRGAAREALVGRLSALDVELVQRARDRVDAETERVLARGAEEELSAFRAAMAPEAYTRAIRLAVDRLVRERLGLPTIAFRQG